MNSKDLVMTDVFMLRILMLSVPIYLLLYVDDMLISSKHKKEIEKLKSQLSEHFEIKDIGSAKRIIEMEIVIIRNERKLFLNQLTI